MMIGTTSGENGNIFKASPLSTNENRACRSDAKKSWESNEINSELLRIILYCAVLVLHMFALDSSMLVKWEYEYISPHIFPLLCLQIVHASYLPIFHPKVRDRES